jgi:arginase family enzyme
MNVHVAELEHFQSAADKGTMRQPAVLALRGWACDRYTSAGMRGASLLAHAAAARLGVPSRELGDPHPPMNLGWRESLARAQPYLSDVARQVNELVRDHRLPFIFANRCAVSLATIPAMLRLRPNTKIIWLDAHGDFNTPATTPTGYLGGMVLSALCGLWDSGLGAGLAPDRLILAGVHNLDPGERKLIAEQRVRVVAGEVGMIDAGRVIDAAAGAPVWIHVDTDVVDPSYLPAEYKIEDGLRPSVLHALLRGLVRASEIVGFELTEFEAPKNPERRARAVRTVMRMIEPLFCAGSERGMSN